MAISLEFLPPIVIAAATARHFNRRVNPQRLYIATNGHVCAVDPQTGAEIWRTRLQLGVLSSTRSEDVSVILRDGVLYAGCNGNLFALSAEDGKILWHNSLKGLGYNDISLAMEGVSVQFVQKVIRTDSNSST